MQDKNNHNLENIKIELEKVLSKKLNKEILIKSIEEIGSGRHSNGYKIVTNSGNYFLKKIKAHDLGFEFPERKISSLLVSHFMANRFDDISNPKSLGIFIQDDELREIPRIKEESEIYQIQEYGGEGTSYIDILEKKNKESIDNIDKKELDKIIDFIINIHKIKHPSKDKKIIDYVYNDYLRNVIGHQEFMLQLLHEIPKDNIVLSPDKQTEYLGLMIENMHYFKDRGERLCALHGDFWGANIFFKDDSEIFVIDHSRTPWGDPGFDIGFFIGNLIIKYHKTKNKYYKELVDYFLEKYIEKTHDKEIINTIPYSLGLICVIYSSPRFVPDIDDQTRKAFYDHTVEMLKQKKFFWNE